MPLLPRPPAPYYCPPPVSGPVHLWLAVRARGRLLDPRALEFMLALRAMIWGLVLLTAPTAFAALPAYRILATLAPEAVWGGISLVCGVVQLRAVWGEHWRARRAAAASLAVLWGGCALAFALAVDGPGAPVYGLMALSQTWIFLRLGWRHPWTH